MEYSLARGAVNILKSFLYPTCVNCRGVSAVVSLKSSFLFLSVSCGVLISGKQTGFEKS